MAKKMFNLAVDFEGVIAQDLEALAALVASAALMLGVVVRRAAVKQAAYQHRDGKFYRYGQEKAGSTVYSATSQGMYKTFRREIELFISVPHGEQVPRMNLTHEYRDISNVIPAWEDLRQLPRSSRVWIELPGDDLPKWHSIRKVLAHPSFHHSNIHILDLTPPREDADQ